LLGWLVVSMVAVIAVVSPSRAGRGGTGPPSRPHMAARTRAARTAGVHLRLSIDGVAGIEAAGVVDFVHHGSALTWTFGRLGLAPIEERRIGVTTFLRVPGEATAATATAARWVAAAAPAVSGVDVERILRSLPRAREVGTDRAGRVVRATVTLDGVDAELQLFDFGRPPPVEAPPPTSVIRG
jgi:hypothetical protein